MLNHVIITTKEGINIYEFETAIEAAVFHNTEIKNPVNLSVIVNFELMEITENFMLPKVKSFSGEFFNDIFVGSFELEEWNGTIEKHEGAISVHDVDFNYLDYDQFKRDKDAKITSLQLAGARKIGENHNTEQVFFVYQDQMIAVDCVGNVSVSSKINTWNESIDQLLYSEEEYDENN